MKGKTAVFYVLAVALFFVLSTGFMIAGSLQNAAAGPQDTAANTAAQEDTLPAQGETQPGNAGGKADGAAGMTASGQGEGNKADSSGSADAAGKAGEGDTGQTGAAADKTNAEKTKTAADKAGSTRDQAVSANAAASEGKEAEQQDYAAIRRAHERIVVLDPGHGGDDPGLTAAVSLKDTKESGANAELTEKAVVLDLAKRAGALLEEEGIYVLYARQDDTAVEDADRVKQANRIPADFYIGIHLTGFEDSSVHGIGCVYNPDFYMQDYDCGAFAESLLKAVSKETGEKALAPDPEYKKEPALSELMTCGAVLQAGCISNHQERRLLMREDYRDRIAEGIRKAVLQAFEKRDAAREALAKENP